jgi:hypothetical protein
VADDEHGDCNCGGLSGTVALVAAILVTVMGALLVFAVWWRLMRWLAGW